MRVILMILLFALEILQAQEIPKDKTPIKLAVDSIKTLTMPPFKIVTLPNVMLAGICTLQRVTIPGKASY